MLSLILYGAMMKEFHSSWVRLVCRNTNCLSKTADFRQVSATIELPISLVGHFFCNCLSASVSSTVFSPIAGAIENSPPFSNSVPTHHFLVVGSLLAHAFGSLPIQ